MWDVRYLPAAEQERDKPPGATIKMKVSELRSADEVHKQDMQDLDYRREYERTRLANDVAIKVIQFRIKHRMSQADLGKLLGWKQPNVARLESGDHEPSVATLARLADALGLDFSLDIKRGRVRLRYAARDAVNHAGERQRA
jgi:ribosome-binding protein aMBF1 (putative translation factor)